MTTRRDFLQYLGIGSLVAAVHNVDALGITTIEKKLIVPHKLGTIKIYTGSPGDSTLLATLDFDDPLFPASIITGPCIATGIARWARIEHPEYGDFDAAVRGEKDGKSLVFDNLNFVTGGVVDIHSLVFTP